MRKIISALIALSLAVSSCIFVNAEEALSLSASAYVLYCADNSQVLAQSNMNTPMGMASTTKIMTALLTLEAAESADTVVEFTSDMTAEGSSMYLKVGDKVRLSDLAAGMMTVSGNDAANAAAVAIGGSIEGFAQLMNERSAELGMKNTNFVTPSGLSDAEHYSTAYDMALLMSEAVKNKAFAELTAQESVTVDFIYPESQQVTYYNHNRLLSSYEYCTGGKTGYTISTGRCLVTVAESDGLTLIAVTLNDRNDWADHKALYEYGFSQYSAVASRSDSPYSVSVAGADSKSVTVSAKENKKAVVTKEDAERVECRVYLPSVVFAPVISGDVLGREVYTLDGEVILENDLVAVSTASTLECSAFLRFWYRLIC